MKKNIAILITCMAILVGQNKSGNCSSDLEVFYAKSEEALKKVRSYYFEGLIQMEFKMGTGMSMKTDSKQIVAGIWPDHVLSEISTDSPMFPFGFTSVCDGKKTYTYMKQSNSYFIGDYVPLKSDDKKTSSLNLQDLSNTLDFNGNLKFFWATDPKEEKKSVETIGTDTLDFDGKTISCIVIHNDSPDLQNEPEMNTDQLKIKKASLTTWIDPYTYVALKKNMSATMEQTNMNTTMEQEISITFLLTKYDINGEPPQGLFTFTPPEGAEKVDDISLLATGPDLIDQSAPDITVADLDGKEFQLNYSEKPVLIDFWATWCLPCQKEMPTIEKLHKEFRDKGLTVIGISGENPKLIKKFLKGKPYTFQMLIDPKSTKVSDGFKVKGIPAVFIIDTNGVIREHFVGIQDEAILREAIEKVLQK